jgi:tetratricopeptide (TPR) repeat protein
MSILPPPGSVRALVHMTMLATRDLAHGSAARRAIAAVAILLLCSALSRAGTARAEDYASSRAPPAEALEHYNRGRAHYQAGRYREAVVELERALELDPGSPNLMYNLARVHELLGDIEPAIGYYERYRAMLPTSEQEESLRVTAVIARLRGARKHVVRPSEESSGPSVIVRNERGVADGAFWTVATLSFAALAAGAVVGVLAVGQERTARRFVLGEDGDTRDLNSIAVKADRLALASDGSIAVGAVGGLTAILLYALRSTPVVQPRIGFAPGAGWVLSLRGEL